MMNKVAVSVIVPVYKAEKWIGECAESILQSSFEDLELILVDDGSPDRSGSICDKLAAKDSRIRVIHQENAGVSMARNNGIAAACGEYIMFVDSDDSIDREMLAKAYSAAKREDADMVLTGIRFVYEDSGRIEELLAPSVTFDFPDGMDANYSKINSAFGFSACYAKLIRRSVVVQNSISYPAGFFILEDGSFAVDCFAYSKKIVSLPNALYNYRKHEGESLMKRFNRNSVSALDIYLEKGRPVCESLGEENRRHYYTHHFDLFWNFVTQIYYRSSLSKKEKLACLREYLASDAAATVAKNAVAESRSRKIQLFLVRHRCALAIHTVFCLKA